jgi:hypothetical protein
VIKLSKPFRTIFFSSFLFASLTSTNLASASNVDWSGVYRIEGYTIKNSELGSRGLQKDYGLSHLILRPKVVAADGLTIISQFHIFNTGAPYANSQVGEVFGSSVSSTATSSTFPGSNSGAQNQDEEDLVVSQLYLSFVQEYGQLLVGRVPIHFGLGMYHNSGMGEFDHWYDNRDLIGYKLIMGNLWFLPMMGKVKEGELNRSDDVTDFMFQFQYDNPDSDIEMGLFWQIRKAGDQGSDGPTKDGNNNDYWGAGAGVAGIDSESINLYVKKDTDRWMIGAEAGFQKGEIGITDSNGSKVNQSGFGLALEAAFRPEAGKSEFHLLAGMATGDDRGTTNDFEGYLFDRNYNVGFLMMSHTLGQNDFFNTGMNGGGPSSTGENSDVDVETVSNVMYVAPSMTYNWNDKWSSRIMLVTGWLQENTNAYLNNQQSTDLGYELDFSFTFRPQKGVTWMNELGLLMPGDAFKGDGSLDASFGYGFVSKAAISF